MSVRTAPRPPRAPDPRAPDDFARWQRDLKDYLDRVYADIVATVAEATDAQPRSDMLTALSNLDGEPGLIEQTGPLTFTKRDIGTSSPDALPTRDDCDRRYAFVADLDNVVLKPAHSALGAETLTGYVTITDSSGTTRKLGVVS